MSVLSAASPTTNRIVFNLFGGYPPNSHAVMWEANALPFAKDLFKRTNEANPQ